MQEAESRKPKAESRFPKSPAEKTAGQARDRIHEALHLLRVETPCAANTRAKIDAKGPHSADACDHIVGRKPPAR